MPLVDEKGDRSHLYTKSFRLEKKKRKKKRKRNEMEDDVAYKFAGVVVLRGVIALRGRRVPLI